MTVMEALMWDNSRGLIDHDRTTPRYADEPAKDSARRPGLVVVGAGVLAFGAGLDWLTMDRRRIRQAEREWFITHPAR
jgi:hypothetical protein